jgi:FhuF 2Fe-2S C-terminal domain
VTFLAATDLLGPVPEELDLQLKRAGERLGTDSLAVAASAFLEGYAWTLARPLFAALAGGRPAPDLARANVGLRFDGGLLAEVAVRDPAPAAGGAGGAAARLVDGHLGPLAARLAERPVRRGRRALSGLVANGCAAALVEEAGAAGLPAAATGRLLAGFLRSAATPLPPPALLRVGGPGGRDRLARRRVTCCLVYRVSGQPCATCPLLPEAEIRRRLRALP